MLTQKSIGLKSVLIAMTGNFTVMVLKFLGFFATGSAVMLSEGIHSIADTTNQSLLLIGIKKSEKPADEHHHYGYKQERFFWSLLSACGIFFLGAGATIYNGINSLLKNESFHLNIWIILILIASFFFEGFALLMAIRETKRLAKKESVLKFLKHSGDPTILAVIYEDSAALVGIAIAFISFTLVKLTGLNYWDGIGSVLIGILLGFVAISLIIINREFLLNKAIPKHIEKEVMELLKKQELVDEIHDLKTLMIGSDGFIIKAEVEINGHVLADKIFESRDFREEYEDIKDYNDFLRYSIDFSDEVARTLGRAIDELEKTIANEIPNVKHIDIEAN